jgi:hypothetical protein
MLPPLFLPFNPLPTLLKAIASGFLVLFHICIWSPSTTYHHLNLLSPSSLPLVPPTHTLYLFYSPGFHYYYLSWCSKVCLNVCPWCVYFTLVCSTPPITLHYRFAFHPQFFNSFQYTSLYPLSSHLNVMWHYWCSIILFFFPFPRVQKSSSTVTNMLCILVCI